PVFAEGGIVGIDGHLVEEGIDRRPKLGDGAHRALEILRRHRLAGAGARPVDGGIELALLALDQNVGVYIAVETAALLLLLYLEVFGSRTDAGEKVLAVIAVEKSR